MNLALSNFAWDVNDDELIFKSLSKNNIKNIECIVTKFSSWAEIDDSIIKTYKNKLSEYNITPYSIQSLFFGTDCTELKDEEKIIKHLKKVVSVSKKLGLKIIVFGSPNLRKKYDGWYELCVRIFKEIDRELDNTNINLVIEPNTKSYGGEFFFSIKEIVDFIKKNELVNIKTMIDTHNLILEGDDPISEMKNNFDYIYHIHVSEPKLQIISDYNFHKNFSNFLKKSNYNKVITYEVFKCDKIINSINDFKLIYG